jgi:hypothetical protein
LLITVVIGVVLQLTGTGVDELVKHGLLGQLLLPALMVLMSSNHFEDCHIVFAICMSCNPFPKFLVCGWLFHLSPAAADWQVPGQAPYATC